MFYFAIRCRTAKKVYWDMWRRIFISALVVLISFPALVRAEKKRLKPAFSVEDLYYEIPTEEGGEWVRIPAPLGSSPWVLYKYSGIRVPVSTFIDENGREYGTVLYDDGKGNLSPLKVVEEDGSEYTLLFKKNGITRLRIVLVEMPRPGKGGNYLGVIVKSAYKNGINREVSTESLPRIFADKKIIIRPAWNSKASQPPAPLVERLPGSIIGDYLLPPPVVEGDVKRLRNFLLEPVLRGEYGEQSLFFYMLLKYKNSYYGREAFLPPPPTQEGVRHALREFTRNAIPADIKKKLFKAGFSPLQLTDLFIRIAEGYENPPRGTYVVNGSSKKVMSSAELLSLAASMEARAAVPVSDFEAPFFYKSDLSGNWMKKDGFFGDDPRDLVMAELRIPVEKYGRGYALKIKGGLLRNKDGEVFMVRTRKKLDFVEVKVHASVERGTVLLEVVRGIRVHDGKSISLSLPPSATGKVFLFPLDKFPASRYLPRHPSMVKMITSHDMLLKPIVLPLSFVPADDSLQSWQRLFWQYRDKYGDSLLLRIFRMWINDDRGRKAFERDGIDEAAAKELMESFVKVAIPSWVRDRLEYEDENPIRIVTMAVAVAEGLVSFPGNEITFGRMHVTINSPEDLERAMYHYASQLRPLYGMSGPLVPVYPSSLPVKLDRGSNVKEQFFYMLFEYDRTHDPRLEKVILDFAIDLVKKGSLNGVLLEPEDGTRGIIAVSDKERGFSLIWSDDRIILKRFDFSCMAIITTVVLADNDMNVYVSGPLGVNMFTSTERNAGLEWSEMLASVGLFNREFFGQRAMMVKFNAVTESEDLRLMPTHDMRDMWKRVFDRENVDFLEMVRGRLGLPSQYENRFRLDSFARFLRDIEILKRGPIK